MPTYVYETIPENSDKSPTRFEVKQSMQDAPLERHPETGEPVKRLISGGYGITVAGSTASPPAPQPSGGCCGGACGCSHG